MSNLNNNITFFLEEKCDDKHNEDEIKKIMEEVLPLEETQGVPIIVNASAGNNWGNLK